jgi:ribosomal-protein-alanine N-acetyltransferase
VAQHQFLNPWGKKIFIDELTHDISYFYVSEDVASKEIAGYIIFWIIEETLELHHIAVRPGYERKGIGAHLMHFLLETARSRGVEKLFLEVRRSNSEAVNFYESFGFRRIDIRTDYYTDPVEDALIYRLKLPG